jgi:hypothetical protein
MSRAHPISYSIGSSLGVMWLGIEADSLVPTLRAPHLHNMVLKYREGQLYLTSTFKVEGHSFTALASVVLQSKRQGQVFYFLIRH